MCTPGNWGSPRMATIVLGTDPTFSARVASFLAAEPLQPLHFSELCFKTFPVTSFPSGRERTKQLDGNKRTKSSQLLVEFHAHSPPSAGRGFCGYRSRVTAEWGPKP